MLDHIDRRHNIVRGMMGTITKIWTTEEIDPAKPEVILTRPPDAVVVYFPGLGVSLDCAVIGPDMYPITATAKKWTISKTTHVQPSRSQIPIAPAFAFTAHAAQGETHPAAIVDLEGGKSDACMKYVALSRCKSGQNVLVLNAEKVKLEDLQMPGDIQKGMDIIIRNAASFTCPTCKESRPAFCDGICLTCKVEKPAPTMACTQCKVVKPFSAFSKSGWYYSGKCWHCATGDEAPVEKTCRTCKVKFPLTGSSTPYLWPSCLTGASRRVDADITHFSIFDT